MSNKSDSTGSLANVPPHARERVRLGMTTSKLASKRSTGLIISDEEIIKENGYVSEQECPQRRERRVNRRGRKRFQLRNRRNVALLFDLAIPSAFAISPSEA